MSGPTKGGGFGGELFRRLQEKGVSRGQIYKVLALQRLSEEVTEMGTKGMLNEGMLLEVSKIENHTYQKQLAELIAEYELPVTWVRELCRLIRTAERRAGEDVAGRIWDFFFDVKDKLEENGVTKGLMDRVRIFREALDEEKGVQIEPIEDYEGLRKIVDFRTQNLLPGRGLDVGTANIVSAGRSETGDHIFNIQRNAFLDLRDDKFSRRLLAKLGFDFTSHEERLMVSGDPAFELANIFEKDTRRPMRDGMISPYEPEALVIVNMLINKQLGPAQSESEICAFSVPADPIDAERDNIYHQGVLESLLRKLGYTPKAILEGQAVVFAALEQEEYTGIGISCGGGMFNVCISYKSIPALAFSTSRGGDWIDKSVSKGVGLSESQVCGIKESGLDLTQPRNRIEEAIVIYYRNLIKYTLDIIREKVERSDTLPSFLEPVRLVCAGGTALANGFIEIFRQEFEKVPFPIPIKSIELADDALRTVALGCLRSAMHEIESRKGDMPPPSEPEQVIVDPEPPKPPPKPVPRRPVSSDGASLTEIRRKMDLPRPPVDPKPTPVEKTVRAPAEPAPVEHKDEAEVKPGPVKLEAIQKLRKMMKKTDPVPAAEEAPEDKKDTEEDFPLIS